MCILRTAGTPSFSESEMASSKSTKLTHAVVSWVKRGEEVLQNELVEQISLSKLIIKGSPAAGSEVCMQFKKELWEGRILSIHGKYIA